MFDNLFFITAKSEWELTRVNVALTVLTVLLIIVFCYSRMPWSVWDFLCGLGSSKRANEKERKMKSNNNAMTTPPIRSTRGNDMRTKHIREAYNLNPLPSRPNSANFTSKTSGHYSRPEWTYMDDREWSAKNSTGRGVSSSGDRFQFSPMSTDLSGSQRTVYPSYPQAHSNSKFQYLSDVRNRSDTHNNVVQYENHFTQSHETLKEQDNFTSDWRRNREPRSFSPNYQIQNSSRVVQNHRPADRRSFQQPTYREQLHYSRYHKHPEGLGNGRVNYTTPTYDDLAGNNYPTTPTMNSRDTTENRYADEANIQITAADKDHPSSSNCRSICSEQIDPNSAKKMQYQDIRHYTRDEMLNAGVPPRSGSVPGVDLKPDIRDRKNEIPHDKTKEKIENKIQATFLQTYNASMSTGSEVNETTVKTYVPTATIGTIYGNETSPSTMLLDIPSTSEREKSIRMTSDGVNISMEGSKANLKENFNKNEEVRNNIKKSFEENSIVENSASLSEEESRLRLKSGDERKNDEATDSIKKSSDENATVENSAKLSKEVSRLRQQSRGQHENAKENSIGKDYTKGNQPEGTLLQSTSSSEKHSSQKSIPDPEMEVQKRKMAYFRNEFEHRQEKGIRIFRPRFDPERQIGRIHVGRETIRRQEKVLLLMGGTGSGKTTWINGLFNYIHGMEWSDNSRVKLIDEMERGRKQNQAKSQTKEITPYTIHHQQWFKIQSTVTVIDTPGFGDTEGIERDKKIMDQIKDFFTSKTEDGIDHIDAIGFVIQSSLARLTPTQRYIFNSVLSLFGKDVANNIFLLLTFADSKKPQVISGIKEADLPYSGYFKFNNSALFVSSVKNTTDEEEDDGDRDVDHIYWKMGVKSYKKFMKAMETIQPQSLTLTEEVLRERQRLEVTMDNIQQNIKISLTKLEQLEMEKKILKKYEAYIDHNKNFTYETYEHVIYERKLESGESATNCLCCKKTCHSRCAFPTGKKDKCCVITDNYCTVCPHKCHWTKHRSQPFVYELHIEKVTKTVEDLRKRYEDAKGEKMTAEQIIKKCRSELNNLNKEAVLLTEEARICLERLHQIALKPNPLSNTDYIDLMIEEEKFLRGSGWRESVRQLQQVKEQARIMQQLLDQKGDIPDKKRLKSARRDQDGLTIVEKLYLSLRRSTDERV